MNNTNVLEHNQFNNLPVYIQLVYTKTTHDAKQPKKFQYVQNGPWLHSKWLTD